MENIKTLVKFGNAKLPNTTIIFNMGTSKDCPSRLLGICSCASVCYARKPEWLYPACLPYRERQAEYWLNTSAKEICEQLGKVIDRKRIKPTLFRYNESGDFYSQYDIEKLSFIAEFLLKNYKVKTYGYTSRKDLDFSNASFMVKGSDNDAGNHGKCIVITDLSQKPDNFILCSGDCKKCKKCSVKKSLNIAFMKH